MLGKNLLTSRDYTFLAISICIAWGFTSILMTWMLRAPDNVHVWGIFQGDMPTYIVNAKATTARTLFLSYECPYDISTTKPSVMVQLPISLLALFLKLGVSETVTVLIFRLIFGPMMFFLIYLLVSRTFENIWFITIAFLIICLGGGLAWWAPALGYYSGFWGGILDGERSYYWWFLNIFRNLMYPFELIYHCLFFAQLLFLIKHKWRGATIFLILGLLSNPFLALQMIAVHCCFLMYDYKLPGIRRYLSLCFIAVWAIYYKIILPSFPIWRSLMEQHADAYQAPLSIYDFAQAGGIAILGLLSFFHKDYLKEYWNRRPFVAFSSLVFVTLFLVNHTRIPFLPKLQPLHFSRGYLFMGLWIVLLQWLEFLTVRSPQNVRVAVRYVLVGLVLVTLPDNISFIRDQYRNYPIYGLLSWSNDRQRILEALKKIPSRSNVLVRDGNLSRQVGSVTTHKVLFGTRYTTPYYGARAHDTKAFFANGCNMGNIGTFKVWKPDAVIIDHTKDKGAWADPDIWSLSLNAGNWSLFVRKPTVSDSH